MPTKHELVFFKTENGDIFHTEEEAVTQESIDYFDYLIGEASGYDGVNTNTFVSDVLKLSPENKTKAFAWINATEIPEKLHL